MNYNKVCDYCLIKSKNVCRCLICKTMGKNNLFCNYCYTRHIKFHTEGGCKILEGIPEEDCDILFKKNIDCNYLEDNTNLF